MCTVDGKVYGKGNILIVETKVEVNIVTVERYGKVVNRTFE